jgi:tetratricopeptide (TPR) repeat protein
VASCWPSSCRSSSCRRSWPAAARPGPLDGERDREPSAPRRRLLLYAATALVLAALIYGGFVYEADPDPSTFTNAAAEAVRVGLHAAALVEVEKALALAPDDPYAHVVGAKACEGLGEWDRSLAFFARARELYPDEERRRALRISALRVLLLAGRHESLDREAAALLDGGEDATVRYILAASLEARGRLPEALEEYRTSIASGGPAEARFAAASVLDRLARRPEAIATLESGLDQEPSHAPGWVALARLRLESGDRRAAAAALVSGARADPIRIREELRQNPLWNPLKELEEVADLLAPAPARGPR